MTSDSLEKSTEQSVEQQDLLAALLAALVPKKHAGGRPKGVKNSGPDALEKAVMALNERRATMTLAENVKAAMVLALWSMEHAGMTKEEAKDRLPDMLSSEYRVGCLLKRRMMSRQARNLLVAAGVPKEELDVVRAYQQEENRVGWGRLKRFKTGVRGIGAGPDDPVVNDLPTEREHRGRSKRAKPKQRKSGVGYLTSPEEIVEASLEAGPVVLWGQDVTRAIQEELGYEPIRARSSKRSWLAPINATAEHELGWRKEDGEWAKKAVIGAGDGSNGKVTLVEWIANGMSYATEPTIGECHQATVEKDPVREDEPLEDRGTRVLVLGRPAEFLVRRCRIQEVRQIVMDSLKLNGGGTRVVPIDAACIVPRKVKDKDWEVRVTMERWRAPDRLAAPLPRNRAVVVYETEYETEVGRVARAEQATRAERGTQQLGKPGILYEVEVGAETRLDGPELRSGRLETRWRKEPKKAIQVIIMQVLAGLDVKKAKRAIKKIKRWRNPAGFCKAPAPPVDREVFVLAETAGALARGRAVGLKVRWKTLGILDGRALEPVTVWHTTDRNILTPQIKAAVQAVYGRPLPRSPLLPR